MRVIIYSRIRLHPTGAKSASHQARGCNLPGGKVLVTRSASWPWRQFQPSVFTEALPLEGVIMPAMVPGPQSAAEWLDEPVTLLLRQTCKVTLTSQVFNILNLSPLTELCDLKSVFWTRLTLICQAAVAVGVFTIMKQTGIHM